MMKLTIVLLVIWLLTACSSSVVISEQPSHHQPITEMTPENFKRYEYRNVETAIANIALATVIGTSQKGSFNCDKACEQQLKKSLEKNKY